MTQFEGNRLILFLAVFTHCFVSFGEENVENNDFSFLYKCDWNVYNTTQLLHEMQVKSRIQCAVICLHYQTGCLGFELYKTLSVTLCRFFREDLRKKCVSTSTSTSFFYRRTTPAITTPEVTTAITTLEVTTTASSPCENGGTLISGVCSCVFGCFGQYCQTCINECKDATGVMGLGIAWIKPNGFDVAKKVWCNFDFDVTYLQVREFGNVNFNRSYAEYENGFGDANGDYWLGNKYAHIVSNLRSFKAGFTLKNAMGSQTMVTYFNFVVLDSTSKYAVQYSSVNMIGYPLANNQPFQAYDTVSACAQTLGCGWWFGSTCSSGSPNGPYPVTYGIYSGATTTRIGLF
ncbi:angiopoietin-2-like [Ostrea edulis]|uniref:angiopoietin-2-like n=1 Tax=Ostrea edulis TaxID=37623 RepID=UPI0024AF95C5|nr:angiopoietin-2-like [Ostrea edulis]